MSERGVGHQLLVSSKGIKSAVIRSRFPCKGPVVRAYLRGRERYLGLKGRSDGHSQAGGIPVPPPRLRVLVAGTAELGWFLNSGETQTGYLRDLLADVGHPIEEIDAMLDFGCGCGRLARWWSDLSAPRIHGCDYNRELVDWCGANLAFFKVSESQLEPPLPYPDDSFDFLYAFSVFTHLSVSLAGRWITEFRRVVKPGGLVWFTIHGQSFRDSLLHEEKELFDAGEIVVRFPEIEGTNLCASYWPHVAVQAAVTGDFEILQHLDPRTDPDTSDRALLAHDAYLVQRRQSPDRR